MIKPVGGPCTIKRLVKRAVEFQSIAARIADNGVLSGGGRVEHRAIVHAK